MEPTAGLPQNKGCHAVYHQSSLFCCFSSPSSWVFPFPFFVCWMVGCFVKLDTGNQVKAALCKGLALTQPTCLGTKILARTTSLGSLGGSVVQWLTPQAWESG